MLSVSVVIPVHNEHPVLRRLYQRLLTVMRALERPYEMVFVNDGSTDGSGELLNLLYADAAASSMQVVHLNHNYGQHMAILAGFEYVTGDIIVTLDADCQNPPEEIPKLIAAIEAGHDVVGGFRLQRQDKAWRLAASRLHNRIRERISPQLRMRDEGCMLRAYRREIVDKMVAAGEASTFIPALALMYAHNPTEVDVKHESRVQGETSYNFYRLVRYNFDLVTGFSLVPLQACTFVGMFVSLGSAMLVLYLFLRRLWVGPEADGVFTLFGILFLLAGVIIMALGILGEYIGRIYQEVRHRPRFVVRQHLFNTKKQTSDYVQPAVHVSGSG